MELTLGFKLIERRRTDNSVSPPGTMPRQRLAAHTAEILCFADLDTTTRNVGAFKKLSLDPARHIPPSISLVPICKMNLLADQPKSEAPRGHRGRQPVPPPVDGFSPPLEVLTGAYDGYVPCSRIRPGQTCPAIAMLQPESAHEWAAMPLGQAQSVTQFSLRCSGDT